MPGIDNSMAEQSTLGKEIIRQRTAGKKAAAQKIGLITTILMICLVVLSGCKKGSGNDVSDNTVTATPAPSATSTPLPTATPTPTPEVWESFEKVGEQAVYRVPVKEITEDLRIMESSSAGDYVLLRLWDEPDYFEGDPEDDQGMLELGDMIEPGEDPDTGDSGAADPDPYHEGPEWTQLVLLRPTLSTETVTFQPEFPIRSIKVIADGTVFLVDSRNSWIHVYDPSFHEIKTIRWEEPEDFPFIVITEEGHIWKNNAEKKTLISCDRYGENKVSYDCRAYDSIYSDLGGKDGKRYFLAMNPEFSADVIICADEKTGVINSVPRQIINAATGKVQDFYSSSGGVLYNISNETWYLHLFSGNGHWVTFPHHFQYEDINFFDGKRFCVSGYIWGTDGSLTDWIKPHGCRIYDNDERTVVGELTTFDLTSYNSMHVVGMQEKGFVFLTARSEDGKEDLLLWNTNAQEATPLAGYFDLTERSPEECLEALSEEYREKYGIIYTPSEMKTITYDKEAEALQRIDFLNLLARGVANNPEEFPKDADGIAIRLENIRGHERGHSQFDPHIFSDMSRAFYGEGQEQAFFNMVDAMRAGEETFETADINEYYWCLGRFATWYYPAATGCMSTDYDIRDRKAWKNGVGVIPYTVPVEEAAQIMKEFEQLVCDILDDSVSDDYNEFETALALYEYITVNWVYDYDLYNHINDPEWYSVGSLYRCMRDRTGICWEIAGVYEYLMMQCGINAEEAEGYDTMSEDTHAWAYLELDGKGYNIDPTWGLDVDQRPSLAYFCFTDEKREERDHFPFDTCLVLGTDEMMRDEQGIYANDDRYAPLWEGDYVGMDRTAKKVIYLDMDGMLRSLSYGE